MASIEESPAKSYAWQTARPTRIVEALARTFKFPGVVVRNWDLVSTSVKRELEARFTGTMLGWLWPLVHPMFIFGVYYFVFAKLLSFKFGELPEKYEAAMGVYMFIAIAAYTAIAETIGRGTGLITDNGNLIKKLAFPSELLPLNLALSNAITLLFTLAVFLIACFFTPLWPAPGVEVLWIFAILPVQLMFTYGLTLGLATIHVFFRDTIQVVTMVLTAWMFATPLFWSPYLVGDSIQEFMPYITANPLFHSTEAWRGALMGQLEVDQMVKGADNLPIVLEDGTPKMVKQVYVDASKVGYHLLVFLPWAVGSYVLGFVIFVLGQRRFADEV